MRLPAEPVHKDVHDGHPYGCAEVGLVFLNKIRVFFQFIPQEIKDGCLQPAETEVEPGCDGL